MLTHFSETWTGCKLSCTIDANNVGQLTAHSVFAAAVASASIWGRDDTEGRPAGNTDRDPTGFVWIESWLVLSVGLLNMS